MYTLDELKTWWEVPAIAHFFSLFKSCFSLTDFTIEELEHSLLSDGEDDKATAFTSRLLTELLQGCYNNPNISLATYHESLIHIMKTRWEEEDGRVNPLSTVNADFHSLPTQLKVQIIHRLTEYRLDADDIDTKLSGLNPSDLRLEPLGIDRNGSKYWYFFGVRLYKDTPPAVKKSKKKKHGSKIKKKASKQPVLHSGTINQAFLKLVSGESSDVSRICDPSHLFKQGGEFKDKKSKKKSKKKRKQEKVIPTGLGFRPSSPGRSSWEVVCYTVKDWQDLAECLKGGEYLGEQALRRLIMDNFLPNLPKIVEDMEQQKLQKDQTEQHPRRSSCRLLAKKLYEEEDGSTNHKYVETLKKKQKAREELQLRERDERMKTDFERMLEVELKRKKKETYARWKKEREERKRKRLVEGLPAESESSSDDSLIVDDDLLLLRLNPPQTNQLLSKPPKSNDTPRPPTKSDDASLPAPSKRRGRPPSKIKKESSPQDQVLKERKKNTERDKTTNKNDKKSQDPTLELYVKPAQDHEYGAMKKVWELLDNHSEAWPFQKPVEDWYAPGYHEIVKIPMDLSTIELKIIERQYKAVTEFQSDVVLMFDNCRLYNGPDSEYTDLADELEKLFQKSLRSALIRKRKSASQAAVRRKPGRPKKSVSNDSSSPVLPPPPPHVSQLSIDDTGLDLDLESNEEPSEEESSDEFTPPGVSKRKLRLSRLESFGRGKPPAKGRGRGRGGRLSSDASEVKAKQKSSSESSMSESDHNEEDKKENKIQIPAARGKGRGRGRGAKPKRGRSSLGVNKRRSSQVSNRSDSESSNNAAVSRSPAPKKGRGRGRGRPSRGRGRGQRLSVSEAHQSSNSSSESDESANNSETEDSDVAKNDAPDEMTKDVVKSPPSSPKSSVNFEKLDDKSQSDKSPTRDVETSSSSSRASSGSRSPEKVEKADEVSKPKPNLWSLDYLASQARVLDEQVKQNDSNSGNPPLSRKQSNLGSNSSTTDMFQSNPKNLRQSSPSSQRHSSREAWMLSGDDAGRQALSPRDSFQRKSKKAAERHMDENPKRGADIYSFKEDDSPAALFSKNSQKLIPTNALSAIKASTVFHQSDGIRKTASLSSPSDATFISGDPAEATAEPRLGPSGKNRHFSSDQLSSPMTPSSGYSSARPASSYVGHLSSSPYSASDNSVGISKSVEKPSPPKPTQPELPRSNQLDKERPPAPSVSNSHAGQDKDEIQPVKSYPSSGPSFSKDVYASMQRPLNPPSNTQQQAEERSLGKNSTWSQQQTSPYPPSSASSIPVSPASVSAARRQSQSMSGSMTSISSPVYQQTNQSASATASSISQKSGNPPAAVRQHSTPLGTMPPTPPSQHAPSQRPPSYSSQPPPALPPSDPGQRLNKTPNPGSQQAANLNYERRLSNRSVENYRSPGSVGAAPTLQQQQSYAFNSSSSSGSNQNLPANSSSREKPAYHGRASGNTSSNASVNVISQSPTMASLGLTPQSLSQPPHEDVSGRGPPGPSQAVQRKSSAPPAQSSGFQQSKSSNHPPHLPQQPHSLQQQRSSQFYSTPPTTLPPTSTHQHMPSVTGSQHPTTKHRSQSASGSNSSESTGSKHLPRQSNPDSTASAAGRGRRQSSHGAQYQQKSSTDYPSGYHVPPSSTATAREGRYTPHHQNGLLSAAAAAGSVPGMHQDLTASATLRALQQQHKADRPTHAAASMLHYAAAAAQQTQNEQYNRLAATAHRHATSQHAHPLAGVYHPHHQNVSTTSPHQTAAHLNSPWLQAAAANSAAGYPSNLISPHPMDPVYQLMQQSAGMHGQYPMYPNHVMQQLHQQHLQHHMLPKY